jgi:hypothetical protein
MTAQTKMILIEWTKTIGYLLGGMVIGVLASKLFGIAFI